MGLKDIVYGALRNSPFGPKLAHAYPYNFRPHQLAALLRYVDEAIGRFSEGSLIEVGCYYGHTSIFLASHVATVAGGRNYTYRCYDTFGGFMEQDVDYELEDRSVSYKRADFVGFRRNDIKWVQQTIDRNAANMIPVSPQRIDASSHDFGELRNPIFALLDLDLHRPTMNALQRLWAKMESGAVIVLDDCSVHDDGTPDLSDQFSGGHAALLEFAAERGIEIEYDAGKLAVIRR
jgi:cephalosporin hydroxylase